MALLLVLLAPAAAARAADGPRPLTELEPRFRASVVRGWRDFQTSFAADGVACVHCHTRHENLRPWAAAYPKVQVLDGRPHQVKGLRQVVAEVLETHTDISPAARESRVEDLVAYISWWGDGTPITPGCSEPTAPPAVDRAALGAAVERGRAAFVDRECNGCHGRRDHLDVASFPRYVDEVGAVQCLESFLARHLEAQGLGTFAPESPEVTDLAAHLMEGAAGQVLRPGGRSP